MQVRLIGLNKEAKETQTLRNMREEMISLKRRSMEQKR